MFYIKNLFFFSKRFNSFLFREREKKTWRGIRYNYRAFFKSQGNLMKLSRKRNVNHSWARQILLKTCVCVCLLLWQLFKFFIVSKSRESKCISRLNLISSSKRQLAIKISYCWFLAQIQAQQGVIYFKSSEKKKTWFLLESKSMRRNDTRTIVEISKRSDLINHVRESTLLKKKLLTPRVIDALAFYFFRTRSLCVRLLCLCDRSSFFTGKLKIDASRVISDDSTRIV